jgi:drug/metabolite transporter (DMT)-like permease
MTSSTPDPRPVPPASASGRTSSSTAADAVFRTALRDMLVLLGVLTVLGIGVGALVAGQRGVWGALVGIGLALVFSGTTVVSMLRTAHASVQTMAAVVMGAWLAKVLVVIVVLAIIQDRTFYDRTVLAVVLLVGVVGSALLDYRAVSRGRIPYVEPASSGQDEGPA